MLHYSPYTRRTIRSGIQELIEGQPYTHAVTLNADRELGPRRIRTIFGTFCHKLDREILACQNARQFPQEQRFNAIAFPENLGTNAHLHVHADLRRAAEGRTDQQLFDLIRRCWLQSTRGSGSVDIQQLFGDGWAAYCTKKFSSNDPVYFLSSDFHPH